MKRQKIGMCGMRKVIPMVAVMALALATVGIAIAHGNGDATSYADLENIENLQNRPFGFPRCGHMGRGGLRFGFPISVSDEFKDNVMNIAKSDPDVQNLLGAGYENVHIQPIINATVQGNGDVTIKATGAIVTLRNNENRALVQVDMEAGKVTKIVTVTVIEKS